MTTPGGGPAAAASRAFTPGAASRRAITLIRECNQYDCPSPPVAVRVLTQMCELVHNGITLDAFPAPTAPRHEVGEFFIWARQGVISHAEDRNKLLLAQGAAAITPNEFTKMTQAEPGIAGLTAAMVAAWTADAGQFEGRRRESARKQLENEGVDEGAIAATIGDTASLRAYIQRQRRELQAKLAGIRSTTLAADPLNPVTANDRQLYERHRSWFEGGAGGDDAAYPNDNAVDYLVLLWDFVSLMGDRKFRDADALQHAVVYAFEVITAQLTCQATSKGWAVLKTITGITSDGTDISAAIRMWASDGLRNDEAMTDLEDKRLTPAHLRTALRSLRLASHFAGCRSAFTILQMAPDEAARCLIELSVKEAELDALRPQVRGFASLGEGMVMSHSILWLLMGSRGDLTRSITGRNDLSVPQIAANVAGTASPGLDALKPRAWAITISPDAFVSAAMHTGGADAPGLGGNDTIQRQRGVST